MSGPAAGDLIRGTYRLLEELGEGGMATVWKALHTTLRHEVAVKFITSLGSGGLIDPQARFLEEARTAASVRHRNVVDIIDFGTTEDGQPYMVMEYMEGETLGDRLDREEPLDLMEILHVAAGSLSGLAAVHDKGIVHRDLKPDNIFLITDADGTFPKLLDFGVSKSDEQRERGSRPHTKEGVLLGTPQYMSPEQARGLKDVDHRTDIYSMGVILYEALTHQLPYDSENVGDVLIMVMQGEAPPVSSIRRDLDPALSRVVETAMQRDREKRFQDAREMREALLEAMRLSMSGEMEAEGGSGAYLMPGAAAWSVDEWTNVGKRPPSFSRSAEERAATVAAKHRPPTPGAEGEDREDTETQETKAAEIPKRVSLPAPVVPAKRGFPWVRVLLLLVLLGAAGAYAYELQAPGTFASLEAQGRGLVGLTAAPANEDAGAYDGDAGPPDGGPSMIHVVLRGVPGRSVITLDGREITGAELEASRGVEHPDEVTLTMPERAGPFEVRVEAPGFEPWSARRWALEDSSFRLRLVGIDAGVDAGPVEPEESAQPTRRRGRRRGRRGRRRRRRR